MCGTYKNTHVQAHTIKTKIALQEHKESIQNIKHIKRGTYIHTYIHTLFGPNMNICTYIHTHIHTRTYMLQEYEESEEDQTAVVYAEDFFTAQALMPADPGTVCMCVYMYVWYVFMYVCVCSLLHKP